ncbi:hypothetical protein PAMP_004674 [Pampus punctatissimus]
MDSQKHDLHPAWNKRLSCPLWCALGAEQAQDSRYVFRLNIRATPLLQASHTPPSRCHSFHFLQSKVTRSAALQRVSLLSAAILQTPESEILPSDHCSNVAKMCSHLSDDASQ